MTMQVRGTETAAQHSGREGGNNPKLNKINKYKLKSSVILCSDSQISEVHEDTKLKLKPEELLQAVAPSPSLENNAVTNTHTRACVFIYLNSQQRLTLRLNRTQQACTLTHPVLQASAHQSRPLTPCLLSRLQASSSPFSCQAFAMNRCMKALYVQPKCGALFKAGYEIKQQLLLSFRVEVNVGHSTRARV